MSDRSVHLPWQDPAPLRLSLISPESISPLIWPHEVLLGEAAGLLGEAWPPWNQTGLT